MVNDFYYFFNGINDFYYGRSFLLSMVVLLLAYGLVLMSFIMEGFFGFLWLFSCWRMALC